MIKYMLNIGLLSVLALATAGTPISLHAQDAAATNSAATNKPIAVPFRRPLPFYGKLRALDVSAQTITIRSTTLEITPDTKITKDGNPATLADGVIGEAVSGKYQRTAQGKLEALMVNFGKKAKAAASVSNSKTNKP